MLKPGAKRFYKTVASEPAPDAPGRIRILLDQRPVRTPTGAELNLPGQELADAVTAEWEAQADDIVPGDMPMTQLAFTAIDRIGRERTAIVENTAKYAETDLICYRAETPLDLTERQAEAWDPLLQWSADVLGAPLSPTTGILPTDQPAESLDRFKVLVDELDDFRLAALAVAVQSAGSLVIGMALIHGHLNANGAVAASQLDETYQREKWGDDKEAIDRLKALTAEIQDAERFLSLL